MLWSHAHSASTASDARGARARQRTDRMEVGRRQWSDALLRSAGPRSDEDGAFCRLEGHERIHASIASAVAITAASSIERAARARIRLPHAQDHETCTGRVDREHGRRRASHGSNRSCASSRARSAPLSRWATRAERDRRRFVVCAGGGSSRRAHAHGGDHRSPGQPCPGERTRYVLRAAGVDRKSPGRSRVAQSSEAAHWRSEQAAEPTALVCRSQRRALRCRRSAHQSARHAEEALIHLGSWRGACLSHALSRLAYDEERP